MAASSKGRKARYALAESDNADAGVILKDGDSSIKLGEGPAQLKRTPSQKSLSKSENKMYTTMLRFKHEGDRNRYIQFRREAFSVTGFGIFLMLATVLVVARGARVWKHQPPNEVDVAYFLGVIANIASHVLGLLVGGLLWLYHYLSKVESMVLSSPSSSFIGRHSKIQGIVNSITRFLHRYLTLIEYSFVVFSTIGAGLMLLARSMSTTCSMHDRMLVWAPKLCNPEAGRLSQTDAAVVLMAPLMIQTFAKCPHRLSVFIAWCCSFVAVLAIIIIDSKVFCCGTNLVFVFAIGCVLYEIERREIVLYLQSRKIHLTEAVASSRMIETQKSALQATILRQVVANISHDLLSPIQALDMGFESLTQIFEDNVISLDRLQGGAMESLRLATAMSLRGRMTLADSAENVGSGLGNHGYFTHTNTLGSSSAGSSFIIQPQQQQQLQQAQAQSPTHVQQSQSQEQSPISPSLTHTNQRRFFGSGSGGNMLQAKNRSFKDKLAQADAADKAVDESILTVRTNIEDNYSNTEIQLKQCRDLLQTMRGSLTFMSMIINRCLDVSKVHGGMVLVPNCEFFKYMDSVHKSVRYMTDMQSDVRVCVQQNSSALENMTATQVYTDKKWFEGNIFCMLSNAIKYSTANVSLLQQQSQHHQQPVSKKVSKPIQSVQEKDGSGKSASFISEVSTSAAFFLSQPFTSSSNSSAAGGDVSTPTTTGPAAPGSGAEVDNTPVVTITVGYLEGLEPSSAPQIVIEVSDCGPLVPKHEIADFFLAPEQATRKQIGGSGMGLFTLCKRVEALGGCVGARQRTDYVDCLGQPAGTTVWFSIPFKRRSRRQKFATHPAALRLPSGRNRDGSLGSDNDNENSAGESSLQQMTTTALVGASASGSGKEAMDKSGKSDCSVGGDSVDDPLAASLAMISNQDPYGFGLGFGYTSSKRIKKVGFQPKYQSPDNRHHISISAVSTNDFVVGEDDRVQGGEGGSGTGRPTARSDDNDAAGANNNLVNRTSSTDNSVSSNHSSTLEDRVVPKKTIKTGVSAAAAGAGVGSASGSGKKYPAHVKILPTLSSGSRDDFGDIGVAVADLDGEIKEVDSTVRGKDKEKEKEPYVHHSRTMSVSVDASVVGVQVLGQHARDSSCGSLDNSSSLSSARQHGILSAENSSIHLMSKSELNPSGAAVRLAPITQNVNVATSTAAVTSSADAVANTSSQSAPNNGAATTHTSHTTKPLTVARNLSDGMRRMSVLVVDDSMSIMKIMRMSLERAGHSVSAAVNGRIALELMMEMYYDVVLMDLQMPVMGGIECCVKFREFEAVALGAITPRTTGGPTGHSTAGNKTSLTTRTKGGPTTSAAPAARIKRQLIIGMSANGEATTRQDALDADMDEFIAKPFSLHAMMAALQYLDPDM